MYKDEHFPINLNICKLQWKCFRKNEWSMRMLVCVIQNNELLFLGIYLQIILEKSR